MTVCVSRTRVCFPHLRNVLRVIGCVRGAKLLAEGNGPDVKPDFPHPTGQNAAPACL